MSELRSSPPESPAPAGMKSHDEAGVMAPPVGAMLDEGELSDEDLEHVVGGLARAWFLPETRLSREGGACATGATGTTSATGATAA